MFGNCFENARLPSTLRPKHYVDVVVRLQPQLGVVCEGIQKNILRALLVQDSVDRRWIFLKEKAKVLKAFNGQAELGDVQRLLFVTTPILNV